SFHETRRGARVARSDYQRQDSDKRDSGRAPHPCPAASLFLFSRLPGQMRRLGSDDTFGFKAASCYVSLQSPDPYLQVARIFMMAAMNAASDAPGWALSSSLQVCSGSMPTGGWRA